MTQTLFNTDPQVFCSYVDAGFTLFPCSGFSKKPAHKGYLDLSFDLDFIPEDRNYGVLLNKRYLIIDCDPRAYKENDKPLTRLLTDLGLDPAIIKETFVVRTPRGGYHVYFKKSSEINVTTSLKDYPGLEFKDRHIIAAGSYINVDVKGNPVNKAYTVLYNSPGKIKQAPQILLTKIVKDVKQTMPVDPDIKPNHAVDTEKFIRYCQSCDPAIEGKGGDLVTFRVASMGRDFGLSEDKTYTVMKEYFNPRCVPQWDDDALISKVRNAFTYSNNTPNGVRSIQNEFPKSEKDLSYVSVVYHRDSAGRLKKDMHNLRMYFEYPVIHHDESAGVRKTKNIPPLGHFLKFDQFSQRILWIKQAPWYQIDPEWCDEDAIHFKSILSEQLQVDYSVDAIHEVALLCASKRPFHPVREYLKGCKWDGQSRLDNWLSRYCGTYDDEYSRFIGRKVLIAAVSRVFRPGCKFDHVLVTEGIQGLGKSYMWEVLASPWFTDAPLHIQDKSSIEVMRGKWVIELAEMEALSKYESQTIKGFLTRTEDRCRMAYERKARNFPRQNIFVGSINPEHTGWLKDRTGNRRYWPVEVSSIDIKKLEKDRDQLWAEALICFERGEAIHVEDPRIAKVMRETVSARVPEDPWFTIIQDHLVKNELEYKAGHDVIVKIHDLYCRALNGQPQTLTERYSERLTAILKKLGFERKTGPENTGTIFVKPLIDEV